MDIRHTPLTKLQERFQTPESLEMEWFECVITHFAWKNKPDMELFNYEVHCHSVFQSSVTPNLSPFNTLYTYYTTNGGRAIISHFCKHGCNFPGMIATVMLNTTRKIPDMRNVTIAQLEEVSYVKPYLVRSFIDSVCSLDDPVRKYTKAFERKQIQGLKSLGIWVPARITPAVYRRLEIDYYTHYADFIEP